MSDVTTGYTPVCDMVTTGRATHTSTPHMSASFLPVEMALKSHALQGPCFTFFQPRNSFPACLLPLPSYENVPGGQGLPAALPALTCQEGASGLSRPVRTLMRERVRVRGSPRSVALAAVGTLKWHPCSLPLTPHPPGPPGAPRNGLQGTLTGAGGNSLAWRGHLPPKHLLTRTAAALHPPPGNVHAITEHGRHRFLEVSCHFSTGDLWEMLPPASWQTSRKRSRCGDISVLQAGLSRSLGPTDALSILTPPPPLVWGPGNRNLTKGAF